MLVEIHWLDAAFMLDLCEDAFAEWLEKGGERAKSVGWVVRQSEKCWIIAAEVFEDGSKRGITVIPKGMITKVLTLKTDAEIH